MAEVEDILAAVSGMDSCSSAVPNRNTTEIAAGEAAVLPQHSLLSDEQLPPEQEMERLGIRPLWRGGAGKAPAYVNQKEKLEHRLIATLKASGKTNVAIAELTGFHPVTINYLVRQPFMQLLVLEEIKKVGDPALRLLANESFDSAARLIELAKTAKNEEVRRKANNDVLDRKYGKPNQPMSVATSEATDLDDAALLKIVQQSQSN